MAGKYDTMTFKKAFAAARKALGGSGKVFTWKGKKYTTDLASDKKKPVRPKARPKAPVRPKARPVSPSKSRENKTEVNLNKPGNEAAKKSKEKQGTLSAVERARERARKKKAANK